MIATDNTTVVAYINKQGGSHSHSLLCLVVDLFLWQQTQDIAIWARHIPGCQNVIGLVDRLSRLNQPITTEWRLHPEIVTQIFWSPTPEPRALLIDALLQDWQGRSMFMFPPFPLLSKVIQKLRTTQQGEVILIASWWQSQPWFPHLLCLCVDHPLFFPYSRDLLSQQGYV